MSVRKRKGSPESSLAGEIVSVAYESDSDTENGRSLFGSDIRNGPHAIASNTASDSIPRVVSTPTATAHTAAAASTSKASIGRLAPHPSKRIKCEKVADEKGTHPPSWSRLSVEDQKLINGASERFKDDLDDKLFTLASKLITHPQLGPGEEGFDHKVDAFNLGIVKARQTIRKLLNTIDWDTWKKENNYNEENNYGF
jgi:hypothetical protein